MTAGDTYRDIGVPDLDVPGEPIRRCAPEGRAYVAVVGIDRYRKWKRLYNAVSDASSALKLFTDLGFEVTGTPLYDAKATGDAVRRLVTDDLSGLGPEDSLVLFFAGHGHTVVRTYDGTTVKDGYLIPVDGDRRPGTWIRLDSWLTEITRIPAKHILVILDACYSGLALGPIIQWRSRGMETARREPLEQLRTRRSRRIITSALDDQLAMDGGPVPGHSLFTGCLLEAMSGGLIASLGHHVVTGSEIGYYVQRRVSEYPRSKQTPDFGALELDDRGELLVHIVEGFTNTDPKLAASIASEPGTSDASSKQLPSFSVPNTPSGAASSAPSSVPSRPPQRRWVAMTAAAIAAGASIAVIALSTSDPGTSDRAPTASAERQSAVAADARTATDAHAAADAALADAPAHARADIPVDASVDATISTPPGAAIDTRPKAPTTPRKVATDPGEPPDEPFLEPARTDDQPLPVAR